MKLGIYGGTFDPVHKEHIKIAEKAIDKLHLDKLIIIPTGRPPHKSQNEILDSKKRLEMCEIAFNKPKMEVSTYEIDNPKTCYTYETLQHFTTCDDELYFLMGGDSYAEMNTWKDPGKIFEIANVVVVGRKDNYANCNYDFVDKNKVIFLDYNPKNISSTQIRVKVQYNENIDDLVTSEIKSYIKKNKLYSEYRDMTKELRKRLNKKRFIHTLNTTICGLELSDQYNIPNKKIFIACTLHDVAKNMKDFSMYKKKLQREKVFLPDSVVHAFVGSYIAKDEFNINDKGILRAIKYHTTGRENMSDLEKIVFLSDAIEKGRDYEGVEILRKISKNDLNQAFLLALNSITSYIDQKTICPLTLDAIDYYGETKGVEEWSQTN